jgi:hypothetical protein
LPGELRRNKTIIELRVSNGKSFFSPLVPLYKRGIEGDYKKEEIVADENFLHYLYEDQ